jgi:hypothetical protein
MTSPRLLIPHLAAAPCSKALRRALQTLGGVLAIGLVSACSSSPATEGPTRSDDEAIALQPTGDVELDALQRLAVKASIDELCERAVLFISCRVTDYPSDPILWRGIARLAHEIVDNPARSLHHTTIAVVAGQIEHGSPPPELRLRELLPQLARRRAEARQR